MNRKLKGICFLSFLLIGLLLVGCSAPGGETDKVALVNGQALSMSEFDRQKQSLKASYEQQQMEWNEAEMEKRLLDHMIGQTLLLQEAEKEGIEPSAEEIEQSLEAIKSQFPSEEELTQALAQQDMTIEDLQTDIFKELSLNGYLKQAIPRENIAVTDEEISAYYEQYKASVEEDQLQSLEALKPQIEQLLAQQKTDQATNEVIEELRANSEIETFI